MILNNRCDYIDPKARVQCNQEGYANFVGDRQVLCKLHTFVLINAMATEDDLIQLEPIVTLNETDKPELDTFLDNRLHALGITRESKVEEPKPEDKPEEKDINRSDKDENEVK